MIEIIYLIKILKEFIFYVLCLKILEIKKKCLRKYFKEFDLLIIMNERYKELLYEFFFLVDI